jgi:hypothetical protein
MFVAPAFAELGAVKIHIAQPGQTHTPEFWAERAAERIMSVADTAPQPIRDQAFAFQETLKMIILGAVNSALQERTNRDATIAERVSAEAANLIRKGI